MRHGVVDVIDDILDSVRDVETEIESDSSADWVAENGPRFKTLRDTLIYVHRAHHSVDAAVKSRHVVGIAAIEGTLRELAAVAVKAILDLRSTTGDRYREQAVCGPIDHDEDE